jgi:hypothetical protein
MRREWTNEIFHKRASGYSRLFFIVLVFCCSVIPAWSRDLQDSRNLRLTNPTLVANKIISERQTDCPPSLVVTRFLHKQICVHACLGAKLAVVRGQLEQQGITQESQLGVQRLTGYRPGKTSLHGQGLAIDIDAATNPYVIHEHHEGTIDEELTVVYQRIAQFMLGRSSILPSLGSERQARETRHAYVARLYDKLSQESVAMQQYFALMQDGKRLYAYVRTKPGAQRVWLPATFLPLFSMSDRSSTQTPAGSSAPITHPVIDQLRLRMMSDWVTLTGHAGPPVVALDAANATQPSARVILPYPQIPSPTLDDPAKGKVDRPFDPKGGSYPGRSPLKGFLTLRKDLVLALIDAGFRWGAIDFGRTSGDLMHFDSRDTSCDKTPTPEP